MKNPNFARHLHTEVKYVSSVKDLEHVWSISWFRNFNMEILQRQIVQLHLLVCPGITFAYPVYIPKQTIWLPPSIWKPSPEFQVQYKTTVNKNFSTKDDFPIRTGITERWLILFEHLNIVLSINILLIVWFTK